MLRETKRGTVGKQLEQLENEGLFGGGSSKTLVSWRK